MVLSLSLGKILLRKKQNDVLHEETNCPDSSSRVLCQCSSCCVSASKKAHRDIWSNSSKTSPSMSLIFLCPPCFCLFEICLIWNVASVGSTWRSSLGGSCNLSRGEPLWATSHLAPSLLPFRSFSLHLQARGCSLVLTNIYVVWDCKLVLLILSLSAKIFQLNYQNFSCVFHFSLLDYVLV